MMLIFTTKQSIYDIVFSSITTPGQNQIYLTVKLWEEIHACKAMLLSILILLDYFCLSFRGRSQVNFWR